MVGLCGLDYDVVYIGLNGLADAPLEEVEHTMLVGCPDVFQT